MNNKPLWSIISFIGLIAIIGIGAIAYEQPSNPTRDSEESPPYTTSVVSTPTLTLPPSDPVNESTFGVVNNSIFIPDLPSNPPIIEDPPNTTEEVNITVKILDYNSISKNIFINNSLALNYQGFGTQSIFFTGTYYYCIYSGHSNTGNGFLWMKVHKFNSSWVEQAITEPHAEYDGVADGYTILGVTDYYYLNPCYTYYQTDNTLLIIVFFTEKASPYNSFLIQMTVDLDDDSYSVDSNVKLLGLDMQEFSNFRLKNSIAFSLYTGANCVYAGYTANTLRVFGWDESITGSGSSGYWDGTDYLYLKNDADAVKLRKVIAADGTLSTIETIKASSGNDLSLDNAQYWKQGNVEIALWKNNLWYKASTTSTWKQVANVTADTPIPHWEYDVGTNTFSINAFTFGTYYIEIVNNTVLIQNVTDITAISAWENYAIDEDGNVYQLTAVAKYYPAQFPVTYGYGKIPTAYFTPPFQGETYFANQFMKVYTDNGTLAYMGYLEKRIMENSRTRYLIPIIHPAQYELLQNVVITEVSKTWAEIITSAIQDNCKIITVGSISSLVTTYSPTNWRLRLIDLLMIADYVENYRWMLNPDCSLDRDDGATSTTYSITDAAGNPFGNVQDLPTYIQYSKCIVKGALGTTDGEYNANANEYGALQLNFPCIDDSTILQAIADMVGPQMNQTFKKYTLESKTQKIFLPGKTCTLYSAANAIANGTYNITDMTLDLISHTVTLGAQDALSFPQQQDLGVNPFTNQQQISKTYNMIKTEDLSMDGSKVFTEPVTVADPTSGLHAVNLHTLLEHIPASINWYLGNTASALANYKKLVLTAETTPASTTVTITANDQNILGSTYGWITDAGVPAYTTLLAGDYLLHCYAKQTATTGYKLVYLYAKLYKVDADGTSNETQIGSTSTFTRTLSTVSTDYNVDIHLATAATITATQRLVLRVYASLSGSGSNPELVFYYGDLATTDSYVGEPTTALVLEEYLVKNGSRLAQHLEVNSGTDYNYPQADVLQMATGNTHFVVDADGTLTVETKDGHEKALKHTATANTTYATYTVAAGGSGYVSFYWYCPTATNAYTYPLIARNGGVNQWYFEQNGSVLNFYDGTANLAITSFAYDTWIHYVVKWTKNTPAQIYVNDVLVGTTANNLPNVDIDQILLYTHTSGFVHWVDRYYIGTDQKTAFASASSVIAGKVVCDSLVKNGSSGLFYIPCDFQNKTAVTLNCTTATSTDTVILDFFGGDYESKSAGITIVTDNMVTNTIPNTAKAVCLKIYASASTADVANIVFVQRNGNTGLYQSLTVSAGAVANYINYNNGVVQLDANGKVQIYFVRGAGTIDFTVILMGYYV